METVSAFLPVDRRHAVIRRRLLPDRTVGAVLFADISGFTHLTDVLAQELGPQRGAEEISAQLDRIYRVMIARVHDYAGSVISFGGDAITCWFDNQPIGAAVEENGAVRATVCALAIQSVIRQLGEIRTPEGTTVAIGVKVSVAAGTARRFLLGRPGEQRFEVLAGNLVDRSAAAEQLLRPGETAVGSEIAGQFGSALLIKEWRQSAADEHFAIVSTIARPIKPTPWLKIPPIDPGIAADWLLKPVYNRLQSIEGHFLAELRPAVALFLSFDGINYERDDDAGQKLYDYITWVQALLARYEGYLLQLIIGDKGSYCFIVFGALHSHEDDPSRAISAALAVRDLPPELSFIENTRIGISLGFLHVGAYGSPTRRTFGVIGNETNVAARLMSAADPGDILVSANVRRAAQRDFEFDDLGRVSLKGLAKPVAVLSVVHRRPTVRGQTTDSGLSLAVVGRDTEIDLLLENLSSLESGESKTVLLEGDAGIGKSRLLLSFLEKARLNGASVLFSAGDAIEQATPYFAWRPVFRAIFGIEEGEPPAGVREKVGAHLGQSSDLLALLPLLDTVLPLQLDDNELTSQMTGEARANSTRTLLLNVLSRLTLREGLLVLAFDDAHWLDSASTALLSQARRVLAPVLFLIAARPVSEDERSHTEYQRLLDAGQIERLTLHALSREQALQLICQRLGVAEVPAPVASFIFGHSEGHPFFSEEIALALRDAGYIHVEDGHCRLANGNSDLRNLDFPVTIQGVVTSRIDRLDSSQQLTLKVASVVGRIFAVRILNNIYPIPTTEEQLPSQLTTLERLDIILRETPPPELSYVFKHNITQEVIYNLMTFSQRQQLHRNAARWYETRYAEDLSPHYPLLAHHWTRAEDVQRAIYYLEKAGEQALRNFANEEAVSFFNQALLADAAAGHVTDRQQRALWEIKIGEAYVHWTRYVDGRAHLERGLALLDMPVPYSDSSLSNARHLAAAMLRQLAHRLLPRRYIGSRAAERAILLAASRAYSRLVEVYFHSGETLRSTHAAFHTLNVAELAGDSPELAEAYAPLGAFFSFLRLYRLADAYLKRALNVSLRVNSLPARSFVLLTKATYETSVGKWTDAQASIAELIKSGQRLGAQRRYNDGLQLQTIIHYTRGDYVDCRIVGEKLFTSAQQLNDLRFQGYGLFASAFGNFHRGEIETAIEQLAALQDLFDARQGVTDMQLALNASGLWCLIHLQQNRLGPALETAERVLHMAEGPFQVSYWTLPGYSGAAEVFLTAWETNQSHPDLQRKAKEAIKALNRFARTFPIGRPAAKLYQGWQERLSGRPQRALRSWKQGLTLAQQTALRYELGRLHHELGRLPALSHSQRQEHEDSARACFEALEAAHGLRATERQQDDPAYSTPFFTSDARDWCPARELCDRPSQRKARSAKG